MFTYCRHKKKTYNRNVNQMYNIYTQQKYHSMDVIVIGISWYLRWNISWVLFFAIIVGASCSLLLSASFNTILMPLCSPLSCILECDDSINLGYKFQIMWRLAVIQFADSHAPLFSLFRYVRAFVFVSCFLSAVMIRSRCTTIECDAKLGTLCRV